MTAETVTTVCAFSRTSWLFGVEKCEDAATRTVTTGCVHEHLHLAAACDDCAAGMVKTIAAGMALCTPCRDGGTDGVPVVIVSDVPLT